MEMALKFSAAGYVSSHLQILTVERLRAFFMARTRISDTVNVSNTTEACQRNILIGSSASSCGGSRGRSSAFFAHSSADE